MTQTMDPFVWASQFSPVCTDHIWADDARCGVCGMDSVTYMKIQLLKAEEARRSAMTPVRIGPDHSCRTRIEAFGVGVVSHICGRCGETSKPDADHLCYA